MRRVHAAAGAPRSAMVLASALLCACGPGEARDPRPSDDPATTEETGSWALGQPLSTRTQIEGRDDGTHTYMAAALLPDGTIVTGGSRGYQTLGPDGTLLHESEFPNVGSLALDDDTSTAWISVPDAPTVVHLDLADPANPVVLGEYETLGAPENHRIAVHRGLTLLGTETSAILFDGTGAIRAQLPTASSYGVALHGYRALVADGDELVLFDVSAPDAPVELGRVGLDGPGFDVAFDGTHAAVALGSAGVAVFSIGEGDALVEIGRVELPYSTYDVDLDGEFLWIAAWSVVAVAQITPDRVTPLGHQPTAQFALGIAARDGAAVAAELDVLEVIDQVPAVAGPEIHVGTSTVFLVDDAPVEVEVTNFGAYPLHVQLEATGPLTLDQTSADLDVGQSTIVTVTPTAPDATGQIAWWSDDPDEPAGLIPVLQAAGVVGNPHPDFRAEAFLWPDDTLQPLTNADLLGDVVLFVYFRSDCLVCAVEVPDLHATLEVMVADEPDFQVVLVNEDGDGIDPAWAFVDMLELPYTTMLDPGWTIYESLGDVQDAGAALAVPLHVVVDRDGIVTWLQYEADIDGITAAVEAALAR